MADSKSRAYWEEQAQQLNFNGKAFINGAYVDSASRETFDCISPIDGKILNSVASCSQTDVDKAVEIARETFESGQWSRLSPSDRKKILLAFADEISVHQEELALLETLDMGKPISDSFTDDLPDAINCIRWCAEAVDKLYDEVAPTADNTLGLVTREPVGVVAAIVPWNYPLCMAAWKLGPALAVGNSVILKPSEKSPLTAIRIAELAKNAGLPDGVLQVLPGFGHTAGKALALHPDVDTLVFTGSTATARQLMIYAGESNMKRVWVEAGGKTPNIVFADAPDLKKAAKVAAMAIFCNQGEVCTAGSRLLVEDSIYDDFLQLVVGEVNNWQPGHPLEPDTVAGAIVDEIQLKRVLGYIEKGQSEGAKLTVGGQQIMKDMGGFYIEPTIFNDVSNAMTIAQEEIFGPVLSVIRFKTEEEAVTLANDSIYGLAAALWTNDLSRAHRLSRRLRAGSVWINHYFGGDMTAPFGGYKQSGNGRDKSIHAFDKYSELKATWISIE